MTAAALLTRAIARNLRGSCRLMPDGSLLARDGARHSDCSTCAAPCEIAGDMGLADAGVRLIKEPGWLSLEWQCPGCGTTVSESTAPLHAIKDAASIQADPLCFRCRKPE